jgi:hypothetical protein
MTIASVLFGFILSTLLAALLHFWQGGNLGKLIFYILASWAGFWVGHFVDELFLAWHFAALGPLNLGLALIGDFIFLGIGFWLGLVRAEQPRQ